MPTAATLTADAGFTLTPLASGELRLVGYLTRWDELDRQAERMIRGSFAAAIPKFLSSHPILCLNHKITDVIGRVESLVEDHIGVKLTARVQRQPEGSPLRHVYEAIRDRYLTGLSVGARFERKALADGSTAITSVDIVECSVAAQPQLASSGFEVVSEGKAMGWGWLDERARLEAAYVARASDLLTLSELKLDHAARIMRVR